MQDRKALLSFARSVAFAAAVLCGTSASGAGLPRAAAPTQTAATPATSSATETSGIFSADKLTSLLPATVYFQGKSAPLQIRNAAGTALNGKQILWASLVDTSGYSSSVQERYQFYLVSEGPFRIGDAAIPAGAYGAGFLGDHFLIMDLGGHTIAQGPLQTDKDLRRPRPLQMVPDQASSVKLYLGRHWVLLQAGTPAATN